MRKFEISITLGDDAMATKDDVFRAVSEIVEYMEGDFESWVVVPDFWQAIQDVNGNSAGYVMLTGEES
jgi:hypothetical protein